jgi:TM2 domain-containing membrane protein YozV
VADWYYIGHYGQLGPLTKDQLDELIEGGVIMRETYVWKSGMPQWIPADHVNELAVAFRSIDPMMAPPPPPSPGAPMLPPTATAQAPSYAAPAYQPYGSSYAVNPYTHSGLAQIKSDKSRVLAGILNIIIPGVGRMYLGFAATGVLQFILTPMTCGVFWLWAIIDGILMLTGSVKLDGYGRVLAD